MTTTFDEILPKLKEIFDTCKAEIQAICPLLINRDLNGKVRLILDESHKNINNPIGILDCIAQKIYETLGAHAYPKEQAFLFEQNIEEILSRETPFLLHPDFPGVFVVDRQLVEANWDSYTQPLQAAVPRIIFFSIKGGVGRSTALAATAWKMAEEGKRVLVLDLDLESPGLSSSLLPENRRPKYGITDWLVEDLVDNGDIVFDSMKASSELSRDGEIWVVPAHGADPGEYIPKLGRAWMPKLTTEGKPESWAQRLRRLLDRMEAQWKPDVVLIDSRAGIDEIGSTCVTELGAKAILLFAIDGDQTWAGYRILLQHWRKKDVTRKVREYIQVVGAMLPAHNTVDYYQGLREQAWTLFTEEVYDEVLPGEVATDEVFSFDEVDESAPHYPWPVAWSQDFSALKSVHSRLAEIDSEKVQATFGSLFEGLEWFIQWEGDAE